MIGRIRAFVRQAVSGCQRVILLKLTRLMMAMLFTSNTVVAAVVFGVVVRIKVALAALIDFVGIVSISDFVGG